ncbi:hypothetical protein EDD22DRAFT_750930, partial [Suillus occidentalis]
DDPMRLWVPERPHYLDELIRLKGRGRAHHACHACRDSDAPYRCEDCFSVNLFCCSCIITLHQNDGYFYSTTLKQLGLRIQLGDHTEQLCCNPKPAHDNDFVIIDVHGIHEVALDFCDCANAPSHYRQLLRRRLFPATSTDPRTAATFAVLKHFHLLSFESKVSAYEFYHSLALGTIPTTDQSMRTGSLFSFLRIMKQWRNLKSLKRSGRGHDPAGVDATQEGQLTVLCPACPQFGKNVLDDLTYVITHSWLYSLFLAIDANFHLKCCFVSNDVKDPGLSRGWGYFVEEQQYKAYLHDHADEAQEKSACVSHNAVNMADHK